MQSDEAREIYEIAIQEVKREHASTYPEARAAFLRALKEQPGIERDWTLRSFFTMPEPDRETVLVGLTRWSSIVDFRRASAALMETALARDVFTRVTMRAFVQAHPVDGAPFRLEEHLRGPAEVLEVAVRRPKEGVSEAAFAGAREAFFGVVRGQSGFIFDRELIDDEGARVVLIGWASREAFMAALGVLQGRAEMAAFFGLIDVQAYQAAQLVAGDGSAA